MIWSHSNVNLTPLSSVKNGSDSKFYVLCIYMCVYLYIHTYFLLQSPDTQFGIVSLTIFYVAFSLGS